MSMAEYLQKAANRLNGLRALMGYVQDGSHESVTLSQDDATETFHIYVGDNIETRRSYSGDSLGEAIDAAIQGEKMGDPEAES